jgi:hypothetical protein
LRTATTAGAVSARASATSPGVNSRRVRDRHARIPIGRPSSMIGTARSETTPLGREPRAVDEPRVRQHICEADGLLVGDDPAGDGIVRRQRLLQAGSAADDARLRAQLQGFARVVEKPDAGDVGADARLGDLGQSVEHFARIERRGEEPARLGQHIELARPLVELFAHRRLARR